MSMRPAWEIKREIKVKAVDETDPKYGGYPSDRTLEQKMIQGIIVLDKVPGPTSHEVASWVKKLLELDKVGHGGTLDPKVTGVLPTTLQGATKIVQALLHSGKIYVCVMRTHEVIKEKQVRQVLEEFTGEIYQRPPLRSSVKRRLRTRYIFDIEFLEGDGKTWLFNVSCQSGTYIRKLCYDIGEVLGGGAHMAELRRIRSGPFTEDMAITLYDLVDGIDLWKKGDDKPLKEIIRPVEDGLTLLPKIWVRDTAVEAICNGAQLTVPGILSYNTGIGNGDLTTVMSLKDEAIALMRAEMTSGQIEANSHGIAASPVRVIMERGTYPRKW